jgi:nicotinamidase-related amidase
MPKTPLANGAAAGGTALLIIDMISSWSFPDAVALRQQAARVAPAIAALKARCRRAGVPAIYANDNHGMWRSDLRHVVDDSLSHSGAGARITEQLAPDEDDYVVLKPKHSGVYATPLQLLLQHLKVKRLLLTGVASDQCVLNTAVDARMREFEIVVPGDCVATQSAARNRRALRHFEEVLAVPTTPGARIVLPRGR